MSNASGYLGIAQRARKTATGEIIFKKFPKNEIKLIVLAEEKTATLAFIPHIHNVPCIN